MSRVSVVALAVALLLPTAFSPGLGASFWTPKMAVLLLATGVGLPVLAGLLKTAERASAGAACALLVLAFLSAAVSSTPLLAVTGHYNVGTGAIFVAGLAACWALGVASRPDHQLVERVLIIAAIANAVAALIGVLLPIDALPLLAEGRAIGLEGNAVHLGSFAASSVALAGRAWRWRPAGAVVLLVGAAAAVQLSGTRLSLAMLAVAALIVCRRLEVRRAALTIGLLVAGVGIGAAVPQTSAVGVGGATERFAAGGFVPTARLETWRSVVPVVFDRALGSGPGTFRVAASPHRGTAIVKAEGADRIFRDAHNIVVEYVVTLGLVGAALLLTWVILAVREARGPLKHFALILLAHGLLEPQWPGTTPVALLTLGAAGRSVIALRPQPIALRTLAIAPVLAACGLLAGDYYLLRARTNFSLSDARKAVLLLPVWPEPASLASTIARVEPGIAQIAEARRWRVVAVQRDPTNPRFLNDLADVDQKSGRFEDAERWYRAALRWDPVSVRAHAGLGRLLLTTDRKSEALPHLRFAVDLEPSNVELLRLCRQAAADVGSCR